MTQSRAREPMFNFGEKTPGYLAGVLIVIHVLIFFIPRTIEHYVAVFGMLRPLSTTTPEISGLTHGVSIIGHGFLHGSWGHVLMNSAMIIIFGIATIRGIKFLQRQKRQKENGDVKFFLIFLAGVLVGGIFQWGWWSLSNAGNTAAIGASGGASALFATTGWAIGGRDKMLQFGLGWSVINIVMVFAEPLLGIKLAWAAHIGGYIGGMILAPIFVRAKSTQLGIN